VDPQRGRGAVWRHNPKPDLYLKPRSRGQLLAYIDLASGAFSAVAIECRDGLFIEPDMQVMKSFLGIRFVTFQEDRASPMKSRFEISPAGRRFLGLLPDARAQ
jgi:hypothetical protein